MSTTIFCTFDQQDLADLAMGDLRTAIAGIKSIHYINGYDARDNMFTSGTINDSWIGVFPLRSAMHTDVPSRPVNVKIVCADTAAKEVKARLVNLRAYQIVTMR